MYSNMSSKYIMEKEVERDDGSVGVSVCVVSVSPCSFLVERGGGLLGDR